MVSTGRSESAVTRPTPERPVCRSDQRTPGPAGQSESCNEEVLFVCGAGRSGTTFFQRMVCPLLGVLRYSEPHFILSYYGQARQYQPLSDEANLRRFLQVLMQEPFFSRAAEHKTLKDKGSPFTGPDDFIARLPARTFPHIAYTALKMIGEAQGAPHVGIKLPPITMHLDLVTKMFPRCKVIHVVRDGRDVALSTIKAPKFGACNLYTAALAWSGELRLARQQASQYLREDQYLEVQYEKLLQDPLAQVERILRFVGWSQTPEALEAFRKDFESLAKTTNYDKWRKALSKRQINLFETLAGETLKDYGYPLVGRKIRISKPERAAYVAHHYLIKSRQYARQLLQSPATLLQASFWRHVWAYFFTKRVPYITGYGAAPADEAADD